MQEGKDMQAETKQALDDILGQTRGWTPAGDGWVLGNLANGREMGCRVDSGDVVISYQDSKGMNVEGRGADLSSATAAFGSAMAMELNSQTLAQDAAQGMQHISPSM